MQGQPSSRPSPITTPPTSVPEPYCSLTELNKQMTPKANFNFLIGVAAF